MTPASFYTVLAIQLASPTPHRPTPPNSSFNDLTLGVASSISKRFAGSCHLQPFLDGFAAVASRVMGLLVKKRLWPGLSCENCSPFPIPKRARSTTAEYGEMFTGNVAG